MTRRHGTIYVTRDDGIVFVDDKPKRFRVFWWLKDGSTRRYGHDDIEAEDEDDAEIKAEDYMSAQSKDMPNFEHLTGICNFPEDWGIRRVKLLEEKRGE